MKTALEVLPVSRALCGMGSGDSHMASSTDVEATRNICRPAEGVLGKEGAKGPDGAPGKPVLRVTPSEFVP